MLNPDLLEALRCASTTDEFRSRLMAAAHELEFGLVGACAALEMLDGSVIAGWVANPPASFAARQVEAEPRHRDPVHRRAKSSGLPFVYDADFYAASGAGDLWEEQAAFGYRHGIAVGLHGAQGRHLLVGFNRDKPIPKDPEARSVLLGSLQLVAVHAFEAWSTVLNAEVHRVPVLRDRERECLDLVCRGLRDRDIASVLNITDHTVRKHVESATLKLGASNRTEAAVLATRLDLLRAG